MLTRPVLYPRMYGVYVALAAMDVLLTSLLLYHLNGEELNRVARWVFESTGITGATFFKFATVSLVLVTCELAGRHEDGELGRALARAAIFVSLVPVAFALWEIAGFTLAWLASIA